MTIKSIIFTLALSVVSLAAMAGAGHDHDDGHSHDPVSQGQAEMAAMKNVARLVEKDKINKSWKSIGVLKSEKKKFGNNEEWVVSFKNESISDTSKQTLYIFLSLTGDYIAANYTGK